MENKKVGFLIISFAILMGFIVYSFNSALSEIVNASCDHGPSCPMWGTINYQTNIGIGIIIFAIALGIYFAFLPDEKPKAIKIPLEIKGLSLEEKAIIKIIQKEEGSVFQSQLVEDLKYPKAKVSRILDRLQGKGIIERKRRGMSNMVILKR